MNRIQTTLRRALGRARRLPARIFRTGRLALALGSAATLIAAAVGAPVPALADEPIVHDHRNGDPPVARIQVVLKAVHILHDRDSVGDGDMDFWLNLVCVATPTPCQGDQQVDLDYYERQFSASDGETVVFDQVLPRAESLNPRYDASLEGGYPLRHGQSYQLRFGMTERDPLSSTDMGDREIILTEANGWGTRGGTDNHGSFSLRSVRGGEFGDFVFDFDVRKMPLPDLHPFNITLHRSPISGKQRVCMGVQNVGSGDAGPFELALRIDGAVPVDGSATTGGLPAGTFSERCVDTQLPTAGQHRLEAVIDGPNALLEYDETNNVYEQAYQAPATALGPATVPTPTPSAALPDLSVSAIKVNGQVPDGKDDCKDGKNAVTVVVKNGGAAKAGDSYVRLVVDEAQGSAVEQSVSGLEAGKEREVRFDNVQLKKGEHKLSATLDANSTVTEAKEHDDELKVSVRCKDDD